MADQPGYTRVPNALLELLPQLPEAECRVLLVIARKTIGWQKVCDVISYSQLTGATGMSRQGVINGIEAAIKRGVLKREPSGHNNGYCYEILADQVVNEVDHLKQSTKLTSQRSRPLVVNEVDHLGASSSQPSRPTKERLLNKDKERSVRRTKRADAPPDIESKTKTDHQLVMDAYASALAYPIRDGAKEGNAAKWLVNNHYTPEQVQACYAHLKVQTFWSGKHISLQTVAGNIGAFIQAQQGNRNGKLLRQSANGHSERGQLREADPDNGF